MRTMTIAAVLLLTTSAIADDRSDWIKEREQLWKQAEVECGTTVNLPGDEPEDAIRICRERNKAKTEETNRRDMYARVHGRTPGSIVIGDTWRYVRAQWGDPDHVRRMVTQYGVTEWWEYGSQTVVFDDGIVETIHSDH